MDNESLSILDLGFLPENIETLFKVEPPVTKIESGFGYMGVLLRDTEKDLLQCHVCGGWYQFLGQHIRYHNLSAREYKIRFGLPLPFGLVSRRLSGIFSSIGTKTIKNRYKTKKNYSFLHNWRKNPDSIQRASEARKYGSNCAAHKNKLGICLEQIDRRYEIVCDIVGEQASGGDIRKYDSKLFPHIRKNYGSLNKYFSAKGYDILKTMIPKTDEELLDELRNFAKINNRLPRVEDFTTKGKVFYIQFNRRFGSFRNALTKAGLDCSKMTFFSWQYSDDELIAILRKLKVKFHRNPKPSDLDIDPGFYTFKRRFGSWNRALASAGLI